MGGVINDLEDSGDSNTNFALNPIRILEALKLTFIQRIKLTLSLFMVQHYVLIINSCKWSQPEMNGHKTWSNKVAL